MRDSFKEISTEDVDQSRILSIILGYDGQNGHSKQIRLSESRSKVDTAS